MNQSILYTLAGSAICAVWLLQPVETHASSHGPNLSIENNADTCADLKVRSSGSLARASENFTLAKGSSLQIDAATRGNIRVRGWDKSEYQIEACRLAVADNQAEADRTLKSISISHNGGRFSSSGPGTGEWLVLFLVHAPKTAALDLEARNGPISVADVSGNIKVRTANGPISIAQCGGEIQARAANGPVSFSGNGGNVSLVSQNGPMNISLSGAKWNGPLMEARTTNGPLSLKLPATFSSGVRVETSGHSPVSCHGEACRDAKSSSASGSRTIEWNGPPVIRLSTENGPVSVSAGDRGPRMI